MINEIISIIFTMLIGVIFITLFVVLIDYFLCGRPNGFSDEKGYIKFKAFKSFYEINPSRWELKDYYVGFKGRGLWFDKYYFHFIDYLKYTLWKVDIDKYNTQLETNKAYAEMIEIIKKDIADFEKRNAAETKQKLNEI